VRALYTLLIAGALNRPKQEAPRTRFKKWWNLVGWPMEYAAGLLGITLDCAELMRAGKVEDEEASATSAALSIMREIWGDGAFTAKEVVTVMTPEAWSTPTHKGRAEALADALAELVGKRLDQPTAYRIGKLFQKRLSGRPAWIDDGQAVATLQKTKGHNANTYQIHVSMSGQDTAAASNSPSSPESGPTYSLHSPHSPVQKPEDDEPGNDGQEGNDIPEDDVDSSNANGNTSGCSAEL